jgi:hypothetical protein
VKGLIANTPLESIVMSALDHFRSRLAESAKAAADAAMQLSSLDELAQNDEYVQSEGLRLSGKKKRSSSASSASGSPALPSVVENLSGKFVDALSMAARQQNHQSHVSETIRTPQIEASRMQKGKSIDGAQSLRSMSRHQPRGQTQKQQLIPSVAAFYEQNEKKIEAEQSPIKVGSQKKASVRNSNQLNNHSEERGIRRALRKQSTLDVKEIASLATIPMSPGSPTKNVLLINERKAHILNVLDYESDTDSSDDETLLRKSHNVAEVVRNKNAALDNQLQRDLEESIFPLSGPTNNDGKDVNRFIAMTTRLEKERDALMLSQKTAQDSTPTNAGRIDNHDSLWAHGKRGNTAREESNGGLISGLTWVKNVASPQLQAISKQWLTKFSEPEFNSRPMIGPQHLSNKSKDEEIITSTSTAFLSAQDMAELEKIRLRSSTSKVQSLLRSCSENPRFALIGVTLVLAVFAYFYSRHRSVDDVM